MPAQKKLSSDIDSMKNDATKVIENLSTLSAQLTEVTKNEVEGMATDAYEKISHEIAAYRETLDGIKKNVQARLQTVDQTVKSNPYPFLLGSVGLGFIIGKLIRSSNNTSVA